MITTAPGYKSGEQWFPTIQAAQTAELIALLDGGASDGPLASRAVVDSIMAHADEVVAILTCTPKAASNRKPRSDIGTQRPKKGATPAVL